MSSITRVGISSGCNTTTSSSIVRSPYSLRRNQRTSDSVVKRTVSRHRNVSISRSRSVCATDASSARQEVDRSQEPSANAEETDSPDDNGEMERSDNETDAPLRAHRERRATTQLAVVINQFDRVGEQEYLCEICKKLVRTSGGSDANLRSHLGRMHNMPQVMYKSQMKQRRRKCGTVLPERRRELHKAAIACIIEDGRPFNDFRRKGMKKFLDSICPGYQGPNRKTVRRRIGLLYHEYRQKMRDVLAKVQHIALTTDVWTKRRTSFLCLTGHTFNEKYQLVSVVLGFRRLSGQHLGDTIRNYIRYELNQLGIAEKICGITSDNGSDIKKATKSVEFGHRFWCLAHCLNLIVRNGLTLWPKPKRRRKNTASTTAMMATDQEASDSEDDAKSELDRLDIPSDIEDGQEDETTDESSESDGSIEDEHDLDDLLGAQEDVDDEQSEEFHSSNNSMENTRMCIRQLVKRVRSCVNYIRNNRAINDYVCNRAGATQPPIRVGLAIDFEVRWNSTYIMLDRFVIYRAIVNEITTEPSKIPSVNLFQQRQLRSQLFQFSTTDWSQLLDLHSLMKPFFVATNTISARDYPTLALAYSIEFALRKYLTTETIGDSNFIKDLKECLLDKFEHYFTLAMGKEQKDASLIAAFLEPNAYVRLRNHPDELEKALVLLKDEMNRDTRRLHQPIAMPRSGNATAGSAARGPSSNAKNSGIEALFDLCGMSSKLPIGSTSESVMNVEEEIGHFISSVNVSNGTDFSTFWTTHEKRLPTMSRLVRRIMNIPATSVPCESSFSTAGYIRRKERCALSSAALRFSMVLKDSNRLAALLAEE